MIYLDNAATTGKKPYSVINAVNYALNKYCANPGRGGHKASLETAEAVYKVREKLSSFFGANGAENVAFCANCTTALNFVIKGILSKNDHVVISDSEHNAVLRPLHKTVNNYTVVKTSLCDDNLTLENFKAALKPDTKMVICTAASNVTGKIMPIKEIGKLCKENGILFTVDGAQGGGIMPIDMKEMNIDFLCIAAHKGLYAPMGAGVLIALKEISLTVLEGGNGINSASAFQEPKMPEGFESGTISVPSIIGIGAGIDFLQKISTEKLYKNEMRLIKTVYEGLSALKNTILYTPFPEIGKYVPVLSFNIYEKNSEEVAEFLDTNGIAVRAGLHCSKCVHEKLGTQGVGTVRISPSIFNTGSDIKYLLDTMKKI